MPNVYKLSISYFWRGGPQRHIDAESNFATVTEKHYVSKILSFIAACLAQQIRGGVYVFDVFLFWYKLW